MKPGTVLGQRYTVTKELGKGSFSVVVEAVDAEAKRNVAIKLVPEAIGPKQCQASVNEAKILAQLEHNHIIKLYGGEIHSISRLNHSNSPFKKKKKPNKQLTTSKVSSP